VGPVNWSTVSGQRSTLIGPRPGLGGLGQGWIRAGLGWAGPTTWQALALPRCLLGFGSGSRPRGVAHGGRVSAVHGGSHGSRWTASTLLFSLTVHVHQVHGPTPRVPPPPLLLPAVLRRRRAPALSARWWLGTASSGLYGLARSLGSQRWGLGGGLGSLERVSMAGAARLHRRVGVR
jgi:hypothetical protein